MLKNLLTTFKDMVDLIHANPAAAGLIASVLVTVLGNYGFNLNPATATAILVEANVILFGWVHGQVTPVVNLPKGN